MNCCDTIAPTLDVCCSSNQHQTMRKKRTRSTYSTSRIIVRRNRLALPSMPFVVNIRNVERAEALRSVFDADEERDDDDDDDDANCIDKSENKPYNNR
jgi:hypothetical protein